MKNPKHDLYLELLNHFCAKGKDSMHREWLEAPFNTIENTAASNVFSLILVPKILRLPDFTEQVSKVLDFELKETFLLQIADLKKAIASITKEHYKCAACCGDGVVEYTFTHKGKDYVTCDDCPICDGDGVAKGQTSYTIEIGELRVFTIDKLEKVVFVAEKLGMDTVKYSVQASENHNVRFEFNDIVVIVCPNYYNPEYIVSSIKLNQV